MNPVDYSGYNKEYVWRHDTAIGELGFWINLMARMFGERHESFSGPWHAVAYYWRGKWYITKYATD